MQTTSWLFLVIQEQAGVTGQNDSRLKHIFIVWVKRAAYVRYFIVDNNSDALCSRSQPRSRTFTTMICSPFNLAASSFQQCTSTHISWGYIVNGTRILEVYSKLQYMGVDFRKSTI
ncbi:hypothetical protein Hdeb2414_s0007g00243511 [Helianthus debilis subsp. tardiflorus]